MKINTTALKSAVGPSMGIVVAYVVFPLLSLILEQGMSLRVQKELAIRSVTGLFWLPVLMFIFYRQFANIRPPKPQEQWTTYDQLKNKLMTYANQIGIGLGSIFIAAFFLPQLSEGVPFSKLAPGLTFWGVIIAWCCINIFRKAAAKSKLDL